MPSYDYLPLHAISSALSQDRFHSYITARPELGLEGAVELYAWNAKLSAAFLEALHFLEVTFRNAVHREMSVIFDSQEWFRKPRFKKLAPLLVAELNKAAGRLVRQAKPVDPPHLVAALEFGFWTQFLKPGPDGVYTRNFWHAGIFRVFPSYPGDARRAQGVIKNEIIRLNDFRNRVAHHEPIHNKKPEVAYENIIRVSGWMSPAIATWIETESNCRLYLQERPGSIIKP